MANLFNAKLALDVGKVKYFLEKGFTPSEISNKLSLPESRVREYIKLIEDFNEKKAKDLGPK